MIVHSWVLHILYVSRLSQLIIATKCVCTVVYSMLLCSLKVPARTQKKWSQTHYKYKQHKQKLIIMIMVIIIIIRCDKLYKRLSSSQYLSKWCNDKLRAEVKYETTENGDWKSRQCPPNNTQYNNGHTKTLE